MSQIRFKITEETKANGNKTYCVGAWSRDMEGEAWWDDKHKCFASYKSAKDWVDDQIVVSRKEVYSI